MAPYPQGQAPGLPPIGNPNTDKLEYMLSQPAFPNPPPGADMTQTLDGPDQIWFLVVAITCIAIPGLFLMVRIYTKFFVVRMLEVADCKFPGRKITVLNIADLVKI